MNNRIIHTKMHSEIAHEVIKSVIGQLSDGIWENSPAMDKFWRFADVSTTTNGEVVIEISSENGEYERYRHTFLKNGFHHMTDEDVLQWFAKKIKQIAKIELKDNNMDVKTSWNKNNEDFVTQYLAYKQNVTIGDVCFICSFLCGKNMDDDSAKFKKIVSSPKSKEDSEKERVRRFKIDMINSEWIDARNSLKDDKQNKIRIIEANYAKQIEELDKKFKNELEKYSK